MSAPRARRPPRERGTTAGLGGLLGVLPALTLVVGKGGVGKTTCAIGIADGLARGGARTLLLSTDPAASLATAVGAPLAAGRAQSIAGHVNLIVQQLDAAASRRAFFDRWRDTLVAIVDRGTYLDVADVEGLVDAAFPGADEIFGLLTLADLMAPLGSAEFAGGVERIVVDTAPTGHTLRLLALPDTFTAMVALLEAMQAKHRFMVTALTHRYRRDAADDFLETMRASVSTLRTTLADASRAAAVIVTRSEPVVLAETTRYAAALRAMDLRVGAVLLNAESPPGPRDRAVEELVESAGGAPIFLLPGVNPPPFGAAAITALLARTEHVTVRKGARKSPRRDAPERLRGKREKARSCLSGGAPRARSADALLRTLTIVGGKGGVGKTTVSCALAIAAVEATPNASVLLVSTDPAPSIGDALGVRDAQWARTAPTPVPAVPRLDAWQMDAAAAFTGLRDRYRERIDVLFESLVGKGLDAVHDRAIVRDLLALAPPGIDELYALASLGETIADGRYERIIVDPAPTGHLLRLLEMPPLALEWSHRLMRLMLKYKDVGGLSEAAEELVGFSRRTRALDALLHDPTRAGVVIVTLDEPLVRAETQRLEAALQGRGVPVTAIVWNRTSGPVPGESTAAEGVIAVDAPTSAASLVGVGAIRDWCAAWRERD